MSRRWEDTLDEAVELREWWKGPMGRTYAEGYEADKQAKHGHRPIDLAALEEWKLGLAEPIYVSPEMMDLVEVAVETFQPERLYPDDLITQYGWVVFPRPLFQEDVHGRMNAISAMCWAPSQAGWRDQHGVKANGIHLSTYTHADDPDDAMDDIRAELRAAGHGRYWLGKWALHHHQFWPFDTEPADAVGGGAHDSTHRSIEEATGMPWQEAIADPVAVRKIISRTVLPYQGMFRLFQQTLAARRPTRLPGAFAKRARRLDKVAEVTVVELRRQRQPRVEGEERHVDWDHRWLVRGHWRNAWCPSIGKHRQVWVNAHVKGPEDKELIVTKRVFEAVR